MKESIKLYVLQIRERTELLFSHIKAPLPGGQMAIIVCLFFNFLLFNIFFCTLQNSQKAKQYSLTLKSAMVPAILLIRKVICAVYCSDAKVPLE